MADSLIQVAFDPSSFSTITNLTQFAGFLEPEMETAMQQIGDLIVQAAQANTWAVFDNPTGALADSIRAIFDGPLAVEVGSDLPYARRREYGGGGLLDSRGRQMDDPARPYLEPALTENEDQIMLLMSNAAAEAFAKMGVPL